MLRRKKDTRKTRFLDGAALNSQLVLTTVPDDRTALPSTQQLERQVELITEDLNALTQGSVKRAYQCVIKHSALSRFSNQLRIHKARKKPLFLIKDKLSANDWAKALAVRLLYGKDFYWRYLMLLECT